MSWTFGAGMRRHFAKSGVMGSIVEDGSYGVLESCLKFTTTGMRDARIVVRSDVE